MDTLDHVALSVPNIAAAVDWFVGQFDCQVDYQDDTWALLKFANISLALVMAAQHPPHVAVLRKDAERFGPLKPHRDGTSSAYLAGPGGNVIEVLLRK